MNLRDLSYLVAVADHRHFANAARANDVSQPTLSTQIKKLERELGVELIERNPRQIVLTPVGEQIVERARTILDQEKQIRRIARRAHDPRAGTLRLGLFPTLAPYLLPHVVPELHRRFPALELLLIEDKTETLLGRLRDGTVDAAVLAQPVTSAGLSVEPLFDEDFVLAVPREHRIAALAGPVPLEVLGDAAVLLLEDGHCLRDQALEVCSLAGAATRDDFRATSLETLRQMVASNVGVTLLPRLAVEPPVPPSDAVTVLEFADPPHRSIALFWRPTGVYRDLLPEIAEVLRELPSGLVHPAIPAVAR
jgi:LysR family transcriptional regulator, hydrogen peroxide-inducible genes activator